MKRNSESLISDFGPSTKMAKNFHNLSRSAEIHGTEKDRETKKEKHHISQVLIPPFYALSVFNAKKHTDPEFFWSAIWVLRSSGHILHLQNKTKNPDKTESLPLTAGTVCLFNSRLPHWTTQGRGLLVFVPAEFDEKPNRTEVLKSYDEILIEHEQASNEKRRNQNVL